MHYIHTYMHTYIHTYIQTYIHTYICTLISCKMAVRGLTDIYARSQGHAAPEGECGYMSKTHIFNSHVLCCL